MRLFAPWRSPLSRSRAVKQALSLTALLWAGTAEAQPVAVNQTEGALHGFLALRSLDGKLLAQGDLIQVAHGNRVTTELVFHFKDGSIHDEKATFLQGGTFRLVSDHLVQKGPTFPRPLDVAIDAANGQVTVRYTDKDGAPKVDEQQLELPPTLANGIITTLLKNVDADGQIPSLSMLAATPAPRIVMLAITNASKDPFTIGGVTQKATHFVVKVEIGGLAGLVAPLVGKQPPDSHVWILPGEVPAFLKSEGPLYLGGPIWRIELTSPVWPKTIGPTNAESKK